MQHNFITKNILEEIITKYKLPVYLYSEEKLEEYALKMLSFPHAYGLSVRFAMKANSNQNILRLLHYKGIKIDASSSYEAQRAHAIGIPAEHIEICSQELPSDFSNLVSSGMEFIATSLHQLEMYGKTFPGTHIGIRVNPGEGSAAFKKISTGGKTSAFGIWHEYIPQVKDIVTKYNLNLIKIHQHIGSENTPEAWVESAKMGLKIVAEFPTVTTFNMGGGFKMAIMPYEKTADLEGIGNLVKKEFESFYEATGRKLILEIEPGKFFVINTCSVIGKINDIVDTGEAGYTFIRTNTGMTEMPRVTMYGVQQPIHIMSSPGVDSEINSGGQIKKYVVVGHCCESSDLLTCKLYNSEEIEERDFPKAKIGDIVIFDGAGAYNASMSMKNYNSFPEAGEYLLRKNGEVIEIRKKQSPEDIWKNEIQVV